MRIRTALALLLLLSAAATAQEQDLDTAVSALVRISGTRGETPVRGSGFVVGLDRDKATIFTASHVIEGVQKLEVIFAADLTERFPVDVVVGMDSGSRNGLAAFQVRGVLPAGVTALSFEVEGRPSLGATLFLLGFPEMAPAPRLTQRLLSARSGTLLLLDQRIGEGFSGGPVVLDGKVVGVVTDADDQTTYAVNAVVAREALAGWLPCVPGEVRTENGIDFVRICPGTFTMGSAEGDPQAYDGETPAHQVTLSDEFWIGKTEITNAQYRRFQANHEERPNCRRQVSLGMRRRRPASTSEAACPPKRNGSTRRALAARPFGHSVTTRRYSASTPGMKKPRAADPTPSPRKSPTPGAFMICMEMFWNGWPTGTPPTTPLRHSATQPAKRKAISVCCEGARSSIRPGTCAPRTG